MILRRILLVATLLLCFLLPLIFFWEKFLTTPLKVDQPVLFNIVPGSKIERVAADLQAKGYTRYPMLIIWLARWNGSDKHLKIGEYQLKPNMTPSMFLDKVVRGQVYLRHYTLVEGWTLKQVLLTLQANPYLHHTVNLVDLSKLANKIDAHRVNFEGYLTPDTYLFARGVADFVVIKKAYTKMQTNLAKAWASRDSDLPYTNPYTALIAASLIEKETAKPEERAKIAGVITRRLQQHMRLQIDASVIYGLGDFYTGKLTHEQLKIDTPYNTYLHEGLPPTPIAMPSLPSLVAALHPAPGNELYYVAKGDGSHEFTATLAEHIAAIKQYRSPSLTLVGKKTVSASQQDTEEAANHLLYPRAYWDEQMINQCLFQIQKTLPPKSIVKHNNQKPKVLAPAKMIKPISAKKNRSHIHETKIQKGHLHHH